MRETSRQREATWLESKQKAHQTVFGWRYVPKVFIHESLLMVFQENVVPALFEVQEGFVWPHYPKFGRSLVSWLHQYFRRYSFQPWPLDYGKNQPHSRTQRLPTHICQSDLRSTLPGFYQVSPLHVVVNYIPQYPNQPCRGAYLREEKMVEYELSRSHRSLFFKNKHTISQSPESLPSTPKRQRIMSDETSTPTPTRYRTPNPISGAKFTHKLAPAATRAIARNLIFRSPSSCAPQRNPPTPSVTSAPA